MDQFLTFVGIFLGAAVIVTPGVLLVWGLAVLLNRPGKIKDAPCPYEEGNVYKNGAIMKRRLDENQAAFEAEQPAYGRGNETPAYKAPAPLAIETPRAPATAHQVDQTPMIDKWLAAGRLLEEVNPATEATQPAHVQPIPVKAGDVFYPAKRSNHR